jgi:hypothetical protein
MATPHAAAGLLLPPAAHLNSGDEPSQTAHALMPLFQNPVSSSAPGILSRLAAAPVAIMSASACTTLLSVSSVKGVPCCISTELTVSVYILAPYSKLCSLHARTNTQHDTTTQQVEWGGLRQDELAWQQEVQLAKAMVMLCARCLLCIKACRACSPVCPSDAYMHRHTHPEHSCHGCHGFCVALSLLDTAPLAHSCLAAWLLQSCLPELVTKLIAHDGLREARKVFHLQQQPHRWC